MTLRSENEYEDLLGLWSDLEAGLGVLLGSPDSIMEFEQRVWQYDRWMQNLLARDTDLGLYLLFQLATNSPVGYSASHGLVSAVLCHLIAADLKLPKAERDALVHAALTMNIAMTALQDALANQIDKPSPAQVETIRLHAVQGSLLLARLDVRTTLWLDVVALHHDESADRSELAKLSPEHRLARILRTVDRYAALISPRKSREGRSTTDSVRSIITNTAERQDQVGHALVRAVGLCPPGTYVRLDNRAVAVVVRRSAMAGRPDLAIVIDENGELLNPVRWHATSTGSAQIKSAIAPGALRIPLNHFAILQLAAQEASSEEP